MKRTKSIRHASFRKNWSARHLTPVALAVATVFMLAGCEKSDETVSLYQNADDCSAANPGKSAECTTAYNNGFAQQPLFSSKNPASPAYGKYTDATGKNYGAAQPGRTMTVPKTAMAPKPATTTTVTRGGFGESVAKQSTMQRSATGTSSRSMGG